MKIAIVGSGIAGLGCAYLLNKHHDVHVIESAAIIGGHTATKDIDYAGNQYAIDTGFIVFNDQTYPAFNQLLTKLGVGFKRSSMGFSVADYNSGLEYAGNNLITLFAQRRNVIRPAFWGMINDILRFNRHASKMLATNSVSKTQCLGDYLNENAYGNWFKNYYIKPMGSAIWSTSLQEMNNFPLYFFLRFFKNHGLLNIKQRPQWYVVEDGSKSYLTPLLNSLANPVRVSTKICKINRFKEYITLTYSSGHTEKFDQLILACHSDQALQLLADQATQAEKAILGAIPYSQNSVILHTDTNLLPQRTKAWSSWNYVIPKQGSAKPILTYNMNILQSIDAPVEFCVSLNADDFVDEKKILGRYEYAHPVFSMASERAVQRWSDINGKHRTWFAGAYWANGFHEDGLQSALRIAKAMGIKNVL